MSSDEIIIPHLTLLVKLETMLRKINRHELQATLDELEQIELAYLDLLLHQISDALWNSGYSEEIEKSWVKL